MHKFELTPFELLSPTWAKLEGYFKDQLQKKRIELEGNASPDQTYKLRVQIADLKNLLALNPDNKTG